MAAVSTGNPSFSPELWQTSLLAMLIAVMVTSLNIWCSNRLPAIENCFIFLHIACFIIVMVTLGVTNQKTPARQVFLEFTDNGGNYPTLGLAVMVGQVSAMFNVCGTWVINLVKGFLPFPLFLFFKPLFKREKKSH
jgi:hypothetical protein